MTTPSIKRVGAFSPTSISGCQLWLDGSDSSRLTLSGSNVTAWNDKSGNNYHMNILTPTANAPGSAAYPTIGTSINGLQTVNFVAQSGLKQGTTLDGVKNLFWLGRIAAPGAGASYCHLLGHDTHYDWHGSDYGTKFMTTDVTQPGIYNAYPTSLFSSDPNAITNSKFSNVFLPSPPNVSLLSVAGITGTTRYQGLCYDRTASVGWCGDLAEVLIFSTALTTPQRQQVEGYLAQKWGLRNNLPGGHPGITAIIYPTPRRTGTVTMTVNVRPYYTEFSLRSIAGCQLWLDAADSSAVTIATGVSQWNDKSGNANNLTQGTTGSQPSYASNLITFDSNKYLNIPASVMNNIATWSLFFAINPISSSNWIMAKQKDSIDTYNVLSMTLNTATSGAILTGSTGFLYWRSMNAGTQAVSTAAITTSTIQILNLTYDGTNLYFYKNGILEKTTAGTFAIQNDITPSTYTVGVSIYPGGQILNLGVTNFRLGEMIVYNTFLNTTQRQQVESYLAQKWGLASSLPAGHLNLTQPVGTPSLVRQIKRTIQGIQAFFTRTFTYTGADQTFVVPASTTRITVYMWAAGGQGTTTINGSFYGGAGAYIQGVLTVTPGETLTIYVGQRGSPGPIFAYKNGGYNSAGDLGTGTAGGRSGIARSLTNIIAVGAGGGGGGNGNGGAGGITSGSAGTGTNPGGGGTQSAGGTAASSSYNSGGVGQNFGGGTGPGAYGGSGGDGFYGGGGGAAFGSGQLGGGGGGGSSLTSSLTSLITFVSSNGYSAPNTSSPYYTSNIAEGGFGTNGTAGNGLVVIVYSNLS